MAENGAAVAERAIERSIGQHIGRRPGPTLVVVAGIHGNEPAGIAAAARVFAALAEGSIELRGECFALRGNLAALSAGKRFLDRDLNRVWGDLPAPVNDAEAGERADLCAAITAAGERARGRRYLADLHTSSAEGIPFIVFGDTPEQAGFASVMPNPVLIGMEEQIDGALSQFWTRRGWVTLAAEGGQHACPRSTDNLEAVIWLALAQAGMLAGATARVAKARAWLNQQRADLPRRLEVLERHPILPEDQFRMEAGFRNLDRARAGQRLARDRRGEIRAPEDGMVILPLYQASGEDGFFWGREIGPARWRVVCLLRRWLPDIVLRRGLVLGWAVEHSRPLRFRLSLEHARGWRGELLRTLGFRRVRKTDGALLFERQHPG